MILHGTLELSCGSFSAGYGQFPVVCALALGGSYGSVPVAFLEEDMAFSRFFFLSEWTLRVDARGSS